MSYLLIFYKEKKILVRLASDELFKYIFQWKKCIFEAVLDICNHQINLKQHI
jgi:hypothetical protein